MENYIIAKATDVGIARQVNEDSMNVFDSPNGQVMVVCDGMGGQAAGDVASQLAVTIIEDILTDNTFANPEEAIRRSIMAANQGVLNRTASNPELAGMGSTCVMLIIKDGRVHCGWVGDSRIYYISNHTIRQISHDQSYVQQLVDSGQITKDEAVNHPQKNEITNCIGLPGMTEPETVAVPIMPEPGSIFLLCSDGLSSMVDEARIERVISSSDMNLQQKADRLVEMANEAGGLDNITVELVQFMDNSMVGTYENFDVTSHHAPRKSNTLLYGLLGAVLIAGASIGAYFLLNKKSNPKPEPPIETTVKQEATVTEQPANQGTSTISAPSAPQTSAQQSVQSPSQTAPKVSSQPAPNAKKALNGSSNSNAKTAKQIDKANKASKEAELKQKQKEKEEAARQKALEQMNQQQQTSTFDGDKYQQSQPIK